MMIRDFFGVLVAIVVVAGIAVSLQPGSQIVPTINASVNGFNNAIKAATLRG